MITDITIEYAHIEMHVDFGCVTPVISVGGQDITAIVDDYLIDKILNMARQQLKQINAA